MGGIRTYDFEVTEENADNYERFRQLLEEKDYPGAAKLYLKDFFVRYKAHELDEQIDMVGGLLRLLQSKKLNNKHLKTKFHTK